MALQLEDQTVNGEDQTVSGEDQTVNGENQGLNLPVAILMLVKFILAPPASFEEMLKAPMLGEVNYPMQDKCVPYRGLTNCNPHCMYGRPCICRCQN